jgi:hypothetical protein
LYTHREHNSKFKKNQNNYQKVYLAVLCLFVVSVTSGILSRCLTLSIQFFDIFLLWITKALSMDFYILIRVLHFMFCLFGFIFFICLFCLRNVCLASLQSLLNHSFCCLTKRLFVFFAKIFLGCVSHKSLTRASSFVWSKSSWTT